MNLKHDQFEKRIQKNAIFAAKHFVFFVCAILLKLGMEKNDPSTNGRTRRENVFWYLAFFSSQCVKAKTINSHLMRPSSVGLRVFFSVCGFEFLWCFSRQRWKLSPSATHIMSFYAIRHHYCTKILSLILGRLVSLTVRCRKISCRVLLNNVTYILPSLSIVSFCLIVRTVYLNTQKYGLHIL